MSDVEPTGMMPEQKKPSERELHWAALEKRFSSMIDTDGMPIDQGIFQVVVGLTANLEGSTIQTSQSCEGHLDRSHAFPWIAFKIEDSQAFKNTLTQARGLEQKIEDIENQDIEDERLIPLYKELNQLNNSMDRERTKEEAKVFSLLKEFYSKRQKQVPYDQILVFDKFDKPKITNIGANFQTMADEKTKGDNLRRYQEEMNEFAGFLKDKFISED